MLLLTLGLSALLLGAVVAERAAILHRLRQRDAELARATRFAVAGELTSALAHELNQPITALVVVSARLGHPRFAPRGGRSSAARDPGEIGE
ncbi:MAG: hypothetical protein WDO68_21900 [Gammaproteobacteria bacterium]